jgi:spermidine synthase
MLAPWWPIATQIATYVTDRNGLDDYVGDGLPVTDDRPRIEYAHWVRRNELIHILPKLLAYRELPPVAGSSVEKGQIEASHRQLAEFYEVWLLLIARDEAFFARVEAFARSAKPNAYFGWFLQR